MNAIQNKPKLVFFSYKYDERLPQFLLVQKREHVKCLSQTFDVEIVDYDCDYRQACDRYHPDLTLFESGWNVSFAHTRRPRIENVRTSADVPKLGFLFADSFSQGRQGFLSDMDHWGVDTFFSNAIAAGEHMSQISNSLFSWPNFADGEVYRDYGQQKNIPVLFTGNSNFHYPWRKKIFKIISKHYPSLICPHPGFVPPDSAAHTLAGEPYARMLNASWFVPACGTVAREAVRKHFEVPACKACLVTERSAVLEAAGFVDMTNCVFADETDVVDKLHHLLSNPQKLRDILSAGYELAHSRHTLKHRDQIFQWYTLYKELKPDEKIIQPGPFEPLRTVPKSITLGNSHIICGGSDLALLRHGDEELFKGNYANAEALYLRCLNYVPWMPEPQLRLAICHLYKGSPKVAQAWVSRPIRFTLLDYKAMDPDPVEWAYFIVTLLCMGKLGSAAERACQFSWLCHPELDRIRWMVNVLRLTGAASRLPQENQSLRERASIHQLPRTDLQQWGDQLCLMLSACRQSEMARRVNSALAAKAATDRERSEEGANRKQKPKIGPDGSLPEKSEILSQLDSAVKSFRKQRFYAEVRSRFRVRSRLRRSLAFFLHRLEAKCGDFLPYQLSRRKDDGFHQAIHELMQKEDIKTVLIIGANSAAATTEAVLAGARDSINQPSVFCVRATAHPAGLSETRSLSNSSIRWYFFSSSPLGSISDEISNTIRCVKEDSKVGSFDLLVIDSAELPSQVSSGALTSNTSQGGFMVLNGINSMHNDENYRALLENPDHTVVDHDLSYGRGYAIFERQRSAGTELSGLGIQLSCLVE
jgi:hypothetical protein